MFAIIGVIIHSCHLFIVREINSSVLKRQFIVLFIGVNSPFLLQYFSVLAGKPYCCSEYSDAYLI